MKNFKQFTESHTSPLLSLNDVVNWIVQDWNKSSMSGGQGLTSGGVLDRGDQGGKHVWEIGTRHGGVYYIFNKIGAQYQLRDVQFD